MKKFISLLVLQIVLGICLLVLPCAAAVPTTISYQGTLNDKVGNPVTANKTLVFSLYNAAVDGTAIWTETQGLTVTAGRFGAVLGLVAPLDVSLFSGNTWLGISVQSEPEMAPRQKLTSVAYALKSQEAETVTSTDSVLPPGMVSAYTGMTPPVGWMLCDGSQVSRTTYSRLFAAIGTAHGSGNGTTTFHLPDYRGRFLRGVDGTAGRDPDKAGRSAMNTGGAVGNLVGSVQADNYRSHAHGGATGNDFPDHTHSYTIVLNTGYLSPPGDYYGVAGGYPGYSTGGASNRHTHPINADGGNETRPLNAYVNWIIKY